MAKETNNDCEEYSRMNDEGKMLLIDYFIAIKLQKYYEVHDDRDDYNAGGKFCDDYAGYKYHGGYLKNKEELPFYLQNYGKPKRETGDIKQYIEFMTNPSIDKYGYIPRRDDMNKELREHINTYLECSKFRLDVIKKIWTLQEKWTGKTVRFLRNNLSLLDEFNESSVFADNYIYASDLKAWYMQKLESETALDGYSKRKTKKSKRRSKRRSKKSKRKSRKSKRKSGKSKRRSGKSKRKLN